MCYNMKAKYSIDEIRKAVMYNKSIAGVLRQLGLRPIGGNYRTINRIILENGIDTSHMTGQGWNVGLKFKPSQVIPDSQVFIRNSDYRCSWRLRERYKKVSGINYCENCHLSIWNNQPIPLEIHHINGNNTDNRVENLQLLCPNCHAQTSNYRGRAQLSALSERREVERRKFKEALTDQADGNLEPSPYGGEGAETRHGAPNE